MNNPFDDPELREQMVRAGIVHTPGMADALMQELAPLLAAEGIDLDDLDDDIDLDTVNGAVARATERHNLELMTPTGEHRAASLAVLRECSTALADGDKNRLRSTLASIEPEPNGDTPAVSHVIGVALGILDSWRDDPALGTARIPRWERPARDAATDILSLARKGRAFDALHSLIVRHRGLAVFQGGCLAVAAAVAARAKREGVPVTELAARVLVDGAPESAPLRATPSRATSGDHGGAAFRRAQPVAAPTGVHTDRAVVREFGAWLRRQPGVDAPTIADETGMLEQLFEIARETKLDPHDPDDIMELFDGFYEADDPVVEQAADAAMTTIDAYVHFRIDTADDPEPWEAMHDIIDESLDETVGAGEVRHAIESAIDATEAVDPELRSAALAQTRPVAAVANLLTWLGHGQPVTQTGAVRRADIERVAGMLGISAVGVARRSAPTHDESSQDTPVRVQSMYDLPVLSAWWDALLAAELIETTATRVRPGPAAAAWSAARPPVETSEMVVGVFVANLVGADAELAMLGDTLGASTVSRLLRAIAPDGDDERDDDGDAEASDDDSWLAIVVADIARQTLRKLESAGLLELSGPDDAVVPVALRGAIARGIMLTMALSAAESAFD